MKATKLFLLFILFTSLSYSQQNQNYYYTGNLNIDSKQVLSSYKEPINSNISPSIGNKKSPVLSGILSLFIPGAGQIYTGEYLKAGIFVAIEAAVITTAIVYNNKGNTKTTEFENYADDYTNPNHNWSVVRYAEWLAQYEGADLEKILIPNTENLPPWQRVNWSELNAAENGSHKLPPYGEQQYYELIGKYHQYSSGWNDFNGAGNKDQISPNFIFYSGMRGDANSFYSVASTAVIGIYVNHFLSALDGVWSATQFNKDLAVKVRLENIQLTDRVEFIPTIYLKYSF